MSDRGRFEMCPGCNGLGYQGVVPVRCAACQGSGRFGNTEPVQFWERVYAAAIQGMIALQRFNEDRGKMTLVAGQLADQAELAWRERFDPLGSAPRPIAPVPPLKQEAPQDPPAWIQEGEAAGTRRGPLREMFKGYTGHAEGLLDDSRRPADQGPSPIFMNTPTAKSETEQ